MTLTNTEPTNNDFILSFIVPFFNVEPYIEECIRSLYNQDIPLSEYEVLCIDDCSPDNSRAIVEKLQEEYPTLKLLTCPENIKQGGARNIGLDNARGKYIWFVDSDDTIKANCLKELLSIAEQEELEILDFDFETDNPNGFRKGDIKYVMGPCTGEEYIFDPRVKWDWKCCSACGEIILKQLISQNNLRFAEHVQYEDDDFALLLYYYANRIKHIPQKPYIYKTVINSTMHASITPTQIKYRIARLQRYDTIIKETKLDERWKNGILELINYLCYEILNILPQINIKERKEYFKHAKKNIYPIQPYINKRLFLYLTNNFYYLLYSLKKKIKRNIK